MVRVAINGFGRIGRNFLKIAHRRNVPFQIVAINDLTEVHTMAHLLKYDSCYRRFDADVKEEEHAIIVDGCRIEVFSEPNPEKLPWEALNIDAVIESTGKFASREGGQMHINAGAKRVIIGAPVSDADAMIVIGANDEIYDKDKHFILSMASCTTNCTSLFAKIIDDEYGISHGIVTTVHAYTNNQLLLDKPHKDLRRARAAAVSMIPTSTGAARAIGIVLPHLKGRLEGAAIRVPVDAVSLADVVFDLEKDVTAEEINAMLKEKSEGALKGIMGYTDEPLVSTDFRGEENTCVIDALSTIVVDGRMLRVVAWYDNEWGYARRVCDLIDMLIEKKSF